MTTYTLQITC